MTSGASTALALAIALAVAMPLSQPASVNAPVRQPARTDTVDQGSIRIHFLLRPVGFERYSLTRDSISLTLVSNVDFTDRNSRIQLSARLQTRSDLTPEHYVAQGKSYRVFSVDTKIDVASGVATVQSLGDTSTTRLTGAYFTIDGYSPLAAQMMLVRYWLAHGRPARLATFPGKPTNIVRIESRGRDTIQVNGATVVLDRYSIEGVIWGRESLWLDARGRLAAVTTLAGGLPLEGIRDEYEPALMTLVARANADRMADLAALRAAVTPLAEGNVAIVGGRIITGTDNAPIEDGTILVANGRITAVGVRVGLPIPAGSRVLDARGSTVIPGLWDSHAHASQIEWGPAYLGAGVTTIRDMGAEFGFIRSFRDAIAAGRGLGPRMLLAGLVDGAGAGAFGIDTAVDAAQARAEVARYRDAGFQQIKIYSLVKPDVVGVLAREAHAAGMTVTGHVPNGMTAQQAVDSGLDQIAHLVVRGDPASAATQSAIAFFAAHGTLMDPTVSWNELLGRSAQTPIPAFIPGEATLPFQLRALLNTASGGAVDPAAAHARLTPSLAMVNALRAAGLPVVAGTDKGVPGFSLARELELYVEGGMTPLQALQSATSVPARAFHLDHEVGTIEVGKRADLVVLDENPLDAIANVEKVRWVMTNGSAYDAAALWRVVGGGQRSDVPEPITSEEYAVYHDVIQGYYHPRPDSRLVIHPTTRPSDLVERSSVMARTIQRFRDTPGVDTSTVDSFLRHSGERVAFTDRFGFPGAVLMTDSLRRSLGSGIDDFWKSFHANFPGSGGRIELSRVGFNFTHTQALVQAFRGCGILCGDGGIFLLEKRGTTWVIVRQLLAIAS